MKRLFLLCGIALFAGLTSGRLAQHAFSERKPHPFDRAAEADRFFYEQRLTGVRHIPENWRADALTHIAQMQQQALFKSTALWKWISMGPTNIAGRVRAMALDPVDPRIIYAGAAGGGVWKSTNSGQTWRPLTDNLPNLRIGSIAVHPQNPNIILAGCGEGFVTWMDDLAYGRGIYRSEDAGATWAVMPSTLVANFDYVFDIAFNPFQPDIILASTRRGVLRTSDGGATWTRLLAGYRGMMCVFSRTTDGLVYAAMEGSGIYRSTDHGETWLRIMNGITIGGYTRIQLAAAPSDGNIVYASFTANDESCAGVFRTSDRGDSWRSVAIPRNEIDGDTYMGEQGQYNSTLAVHPTNPNIVWAGGIDLYRSTNGGTSWKQISNWYPQAGYVYVHADQHATLFNPQNPNEIIAGCDGGVFRSTNSGSTFIDANGGLITVQFHSGAPHPSSDFVLGGTIDNGNLKLTNLTLWTDATGGDGGYTAIDYNDPRYMYAELYWLWFHRSSNFGGSFSVKMSGIPRAPEGWTSDRCAFIAPFLMDANNSKTLYAGTYRVYRTTNSADVWTPISPDLTGGFGYITAIGASKSTPGVLYTGSNTGVVYVTTNNGGAWSRVNAGLPLRYVTDIAVDQNDAGVAYLTVSGFGSGHVWRTSNYGATWTDVSGTSPSSLPDVPVNTIAIHPTLSQRLYIGTDAGMFFSYDGGQTWLPNADGIGNVVVADLQFRKDGTLFAATHGRGMFRSDYSLLDTQRTPLAEDFKLEQNYPNPVSLATNATATISYTLTRSSMTELEVYDASGKLVRSEKSGMQSPGRYSHSFNATGIGAGVLCYRLIVNGTPSRVMKMVVVK